MSLAKFGFQNMEYFTFFWKASEPCFGEDSIIVPINLEYTAGRLMQVNRYADFPLYLGCQTDSPVLVASTAAIGDGGSFSIFAHICYLLLVGFT